MHGLDEYDSEARWYYPAIMRTTTIDPLAEKYYEMSPYAWCGNNPVKFVDMDGRTHGLPESGGKPAEEPKLNSQTGKIEGEYTTAQSTTRVEKPTEPLPAIPYNAPLPPAGEIKDANKEKIKEQLNFAMSTEINKACLTNPLIKSVALGGAVATTAALGPVISGSVTSTTRLVIQNTTRIIIQNPNTVQTVGGFVGGILYSKLTDVMQDLPPINTGLPAFQVAFQAAQIGTTADGLINQNSPINRKDSIK
jgi:hypothetical protein